MTTKPSLKTVWTHPLHFSAFGFGSGLLPIAPGTWGTLMAIPFYYLLVELPLLYYLLFLAISLSFGIWICSVTTKALGVHDYKGIVFDEMVGFWITMTAIPFAWHWIVIGFLLFRIFDVLKPWPIRWIDQKVQGGTGIMLDDVLAGIYACIVLQLFVFTYKQF